MRNRQYPSNRIQVEVVLSAMLLAVGKLGADGNTFGIGNCARAGDTTPAAIATVCREAIALKRVTQNFKRMFYSTPPKQQFPAKQ